MKPMRLKQSKADIYVKHFLLQHTNCSENVCIITNINDYRIRYYLLDWMVYQDHVYKRLTPLKNSEYFQILKQCLYQKGYDVVYIKPLIRDDLRYEVYFRVYERGNGRSRRKK